MKKLLIVLMVFVFAGCAGHVISHELRTAHDKNIKPEMLFDNPAAYKGKIVMLGGQIITLTSSGDSSMLEVLHRPLDSRGWPKISDNSAGRFIIKHPGKLDANMYKPGRLVTVAGEVLGEQAVKRGEVSYRLLAVNSKELHIHYKQGDMPLKIKLGTFDSPFK